MSLVHCNNSFENMSENNNVDSSELTTSQINQSEAGPDTVQLDHNLENCFRGAKNKEVNVNELRNTDGNDLKNAMKQPINVVAPLKIEGRGTPQQALLEAELGKLHDMLEKQEMLNQQRAVDTETQLSMRFNQLCGLQEKLKESEDRERILSKKLTEQERNQEQLSVVMQEYEMLIGKLTADVENDKKLKNKVEELTAEKEQALQHLGNVEAAFSDVHSKYEKCKKVVEDIKRNEIKLKTVINELKDALKIKEKTMESVQAHAAGQLESAQRQLEMSHREHEQELNRLTAMLRKTELKVISLQESLDQKIKENQELTTICDDLIAGRGYRHD